MAHWKNYQTESDGIEEKLSKEQTAESEDAVVSKGRIRKRPKDSLAVQVLFHIDFFSILISMCVS